MYSLLVVIVSVVGLIHLESKNLVDADCCEEETKAFHNGDMKSPDFQTAIFEPNTTLCSAVIEIMACLQNNCADDKEKEGKTKIFGFTQDYCENTEKIREAERCFKNAESKVLAQNNHKCKEALLAVKENMFELELTNSTDPRAMAKHCKQQGRAQECMMEDENLKKCPELNYFYTYRQGQLQSQKALVNTSDLETEASCSDYARILTKAMNSGGEAKQLCCADALESFNQKPISELEFQKSIFQPSESDCNESTNVQNCFANCLEKHPKNMYAKAMSHIFGHVNQFCKNKKGLDNVNECFERVATRLQDDECVEDIANAKRAFGQIAENDDPELLDHHCGTLNLAIQCVKSGEGKREKCSKNIYQYYYSLITTKKAVINAIPASQGLHHITDLDKICISFLNEDQKEIIMAEPSVDPVEEKTTPAFNSLDVESTPSHEIASKFPLHSDIKEADAADNATDNTKKDKSSAQHTAYDKALVSVMSLVGTVYLLVSAAWLL